MPLSVIEGDVYINGSLVAATFAAPAASIGAAAIQAAAGIEASKLQHQHEITFSQPSATDAVSEQRVIHVVKGATATIVALRAGNVVAAGATTTVTVDLLKNGTTILSGVITLDNTTTAYTLLTPSGFTSTALVTGDVLEIKTVLTGSNEPKGVFAQLVLREDAQ